MDINSRIHSLVQSGKNEDLHTLIQYIKSPDFANTTYLPLEDIIDQKNKRKYTPLHESIFLRNYETFKILVDAGADINSKCHGTPVTHLLLTISSLPGGLSFANSSFSYIIATGNVDVEAKDDQGATILHLIAEYNNKVALEILSQNIEQESLQELIEVKDRIGYYPLHRATLKDSYDVMTLLIHLRANQLSTTTLGASILHHAISSTSRKVLKYISSLDSFNKLLQIRDLFGRSAEDLLQSYGYNVEIFRRTYDLVLDSISSKFPSKTAIVTDITCLQHHTCAPSEIKSSSAPPENIHRLEVLIEPINGVLHASDLMNKVIHVHDCEEATISDVLRVHEWPYLRRIQARCDILGDNADEEDGIGYLDGDTTVSKQSFKAALKAAGAVCSAVNLVMKGEAKNAFCPIRPPGHHAGPRGVVKGKPGGPDSHGFCLINNISVGAAYAMNVYRDFIKKVAIVDFDVHHGNGTEETVRWLQPGLEEIEVTNDFFFSKMQAPRFKPWHSFDDYKNVFFVSVHGYGPRESGLEYLMPRVAFYPGSGETTIPKIIDDGETTTSTKKDHKFDSMEEHEYFDERKGDTEQNHVDGKEIEQQGDNYGDEEADEEGEEEDEENEDYNLNYKEQLNGEKGEEDDEEQEDDEDEDDDEGSNEVVMNGNENGISDLRKVYIKGAKSPLILDVGVNLPDPNQTSSAEYRHQWRNYFRNEIFPRLDKFKPDIIFISAGFDAHKKDTINAGYIALVEEDFEWITNHLVRLANTHSNGRIISALEGGYQLGGECCSAFAKSVKAHVVALSSGGSSKLPYIQSDLEVECTHERKLLDNIEVKRAQKEAQKEAQLLAQRVHSQQIEQQQQQVSVQEEGNGIIAVEEMTDSTRKRRRTQVDYTALDRELREQKNAALDSLSS